MEPTRMPDVFVDTAGWGELFDSGETYYPLATSLYRQFRNQRRNLVTTNYIIA